MITAVYAIISFTSFIFLLLLGMRLLHEEHRHTANRLFIAYIFTIALISFTEFMARLSESYDRAFIWAFTASVWPFSTSLLLHFLLRIRSRSRKLHPLLPFLLYGISSGMMMMYWRFVISGNAIQETYGFSLRSPGLTEMPYGITTLLQTVMLMAALLILLTGALSRSANAIRRRDLRWILMAYSGGFLVIIFGSVLGLPEMTGLSYLVFGGMIYLGIHKGYLLVLSPGNAARQILGSMSEILFITDPDYMIMSLNQEAMSFFNRREADCINSPLTEIAGVEEIKAGSELQSPDRERWLRIAETPVMSRKGILLGRILLGREITDEKRHALLLRHSLAEKESMLQEIHHRVYNTLQIISSILSLKSGGLKDPDGCRVVSESNNRIRIIASIYELAYSSENLAHIELDQLLIRLTQELTSQRNHTDGIQTDYELESVGIDVQRAISVTLIATELISNSLRHAFPSGRTPVLGVRLHRNSPAGWSLTVIDNGRGFKVSGTRYEGLAIAEELCSDLSTKLELESGPDGTRAGFTVYDK